MVDEETVIVPGHSAIANKADFIHYKNVIFEARDKVAIHIKQGKSLEEISAAGISPAYDEEWGSGFIDADTSIGFLYKGLTQSIAD